jgi:hypothetical protein
VISISRGSRPAFWASSRSAAISRAVEPEAVLVRAGAAVGHRRAEGTHLRLEVADELAIDLQRRLGS